VLLSESVEQNCLKCRLLAFTLHCGHRSTASLMTSFHGAQTGVTSLSAIISCTCISAYTIYTLVSCNPLEWNIAYGESFRDEKRSPKTQRSTVWVTVERQKLTAIEQHLSWFDPTVGYVNEFVSFRRFYSLTMYISSQNYYKNASYHWRITRPLAQYRSYVTTVTSNVLEVFRM